MNGDGRGDDVYQPTGTNEEQQDAAPLDPENMIDERGDDGGYDQMLDEGYSAPEQPLAVASRGTTPAEQREGESLDERLAQEASETEAGTGDDAAPAEEAAVHVVEEPDGETDEGAPWEPGGSAR